MIQDLTRAKIEEMLKSHWFHAPIYHQMAVETVADQLAAANALIVRAQAIIDPCYPDRSHQWQKDARTLAAMESKT